MPNRLGGLRSCAFLASASWASLNQIGLGVRARQLRDMTVRVSRKEADVGLCCLAPVRGDTWDATLLRGCQ